MFGPMAGTWLKRAMDVAVSAALLALASPPLLLVMAAIRLGSPGPAVFRQERVGRDERPFRCLKLRTMYASTPSVPTHEAGASAITPLGRVLRRWKVDELPQLWNVLRGEMSLVGPRPCLPSQAALVESRRRLGVFALRPGITGLAQLRGADMSEPDRCAGFDAEYARLASPLLDLRLLARTFGAVRAGGRCQRRDTRRPPDAG